jgi:hypothetical protein
MTNAERFAAWRAQLADACELAVLKAREQAYMARVEATVAERGVGEPVDEYERRTRG